MKLDASLQNALGVFYALVAIMNFGFAAYYGLSAAKDRIKAGVWAGVGGVFLVHSIAYFAQMNWILPQAFRDFVDLLMGPVLYTSTSIGLFVVMLYFRKFFTNPQVAWSMLNLSLLFGGWAMTDPNFRSIVAKPDNVPISMLIFSVGFFTWAGMYRAVQNDERLERGEPVLEKIDDDKVLVW